MATCFFPILGQLKKMTALGVLLLFSLTTALAADREIGGYVDRAEDRFVRNV
jgi:hypothetical protein